MVLKTLNRLKNNQIFVFFISFTLIFVLGLNIVFTYKNWQTRRNNELKIQSLNFLKLYNLSSSEKKDYYSSNQYKLKLYKEEGLKESGEIVLESGFSENLSTPPQTAFIPKISNIAESNHQQWWKCFLNNKYNKSLLISNYNDNNFCR